MIEYDMTALKKFLDNITILTNATATFYDEYFRNSILSACSPLPNHLSPCNAVAFYEKDNCILSDNYIFNQLSNKDLKSYYTSCHIGLSMAGFRLCYSNNTIGYVLLGPFREVEMEEEFFKRIDRFCSIHGCSKERASYQYYNIPVLTKQKFEALSEIFLDSFQTVMQNNPFILKKNFFFDTILSFIKSNLDKDLTIEYMCKNLYLSKKQLYNYFIKETGLPPKQFVIQLKMKQAKTLILSTPMDLAKVAESVGMNDYNYFIKVFKSQHGYPPSFYRKRLKTEK